MRRISNILAMVLILLTCSCEEKYQLPDEGNSGGNGQTVDESKFDISVFPASVDPHLVGRKVAERFIVSQHSNWGNMDKTPSTLITYPDVCTWLGGLWFAENTGDEELYDRLVAKFDLLFTTEKNLQPTLSPTVSNKVDFYVFGAVPLCIYQRKKDSKYLELGLKYADAQWVLPAGASSTESGWHNQGYSWQTRLWIDDMFMITALQAQAYLATGKKEYLDKAVKEMLLYLDRLQLSNGMFYHSSSAKFLWGRGNGWMAVGMAEMLRIIPDIPEYSQARKRLLTAYLMMMDSLLKFQKSDGMWGQLVDDKDSWSETSGSGMFLYAMTYGVKAGILDKKVYGTAVKKGYLSLVTYLTDSYALTEVCEGTGAQNDRQYYLDRGRLTGDLHGQAAILWCCHALCN